MKYAEILYTSLCLNYMYYNKDMVIWGFTAFISCGGHHFKFWRFTCLHEYQTKCFITTIVKITSIKTCTLLSIYSDHSKVQYTKQHSQCINTTIHNQWLMNMNHITWTSSTICLLYCIFTSAFNKIKLNTMENNVWHFFFFLANL